MRKHRFICRNPEAIDLNFYNQFDEGFLLNKALTLYLVSENINEFMDLSKLSFDPKNPENDKKKYLEGLKAEIHFAEFHQFEAFMATLLASFQKLPHWLFLSDYKTKEIHEKTETFLKGDINKLTNGALKDKEAFYNHSIYSGFVSKDLPEGQPWSENLEKIDWLLKIMAEKFLGAKEYNGYKHGLRVMTGSTSFGIVPDDSPTQGIHFSSEDSLIFLEPKDIGEGGLTLHETIKHFDPKEALNHLHIMALLLKTIKNTRLAKIKGEKGAEMNTFFKLNKNDFLKLGKRTTFSFSI